MNLSNILDTLEIIVSNKTRDGNGSITLTAEELKMIEEIIDVLTIEEAHLELGDPSTIFNKE